MRLTVAISARQAAKLEVQGSSQLARAAASAIIADIYEWNTPSTHHQVDLDFSVASDLIPLKRPRLVKEDESISQNTLLFYA